MAIERPSHAIRRQRDCLKVAPSPPFMSVPNPFGDAHFLQRLLSLGRLFRRMVHAGNPHFICTILQVLREEVS